MDPSSRIFGRSAELRRARERLAAAARGDGAVLAVVAEAGIGKTALLEAVVGEARERGWTVLSARGARLEGQLAFGVIVRLLARAARDAGVLEEAPEAARRLLDPRGGTVPDDDPFATLNAVFWVCLALADRGPLLLVVDDAHWADDASLRALAFVRERLDGLPVAVALGLRPGGAPVLGALADDARTERLALAPLGPAEGRRLVAQLAPQATDAQVDAALAATGGHPYYLVALADELAAVPSVAPEAVATLAPDGVVRLVLDRVTAAGEDAVAVARSVAVLGADAEVRHVAAHTGLSADAVTTAADALTAAHVLGPGRPLELAHAIVGAALLADLPAGQRAASHRRAAEVLRAAGAPPARAAQHLLATDPLGDPDVVEALLAGAAAARGPGDRETQVALLERALAEPPGDRRRVEVLTRLGIAERHLMRPGAREHLEAARALTTEPEAQVNLLFELAAVAELEGRMAEAIEWLEAGLARLDSDGADREARAVLAANAAASRLIGLVPVGDAVLTDLDARWADLAPGTPIARLVDAVQATVRGYRPGATVTQVAPYARRALGELVPRELVERPASLGLLPVAATLGLHEEVLDAVDPARTARETGSLWQTLAVTTWRAFAGLQAGRLAEAEAEALAAADGFGDDLPVGRAAAVAILALILVERRGAHAAAEALERLGEGPLAIPPVIQGLMARAARARVANALGDARTARAEAEALRDAMDGAFIEQPVHLPWRRELAIALRLEGDPAALELAVAHHELCVAFGAPAAVADALVVLGETAAADEREGRLREAVELAGTAGVPLVDARARLALGGHLRRSGRPGEAREPLLRALEIALECGALGLRATVQEELEACGVQPASGARDGTRGQLTPSELRTARLAADGLTNREIAQALFVTPKTVETHLRAAFRKLDLKSRRELAGALRQAA
ncbi:regulatory LuxR family protein [Solirubrobacter pauli]|uniref:Regulatory LuxR family protein n=1 Tax=Solirubrobacter pauli TaxID=166793 RepID=A0A660L9K4_9ACTN|nr:helix-turn-helix transcriptional regulator [Solirubrobacter pauli]RKQ91209.1 regulatory LuxR family protein [Solirubrobacter pauli]